MQDIISLYRNYNRYDDCSDNDLINYDQLSKIEKNYLFKYHVEVFKKISPFLNKPEKKWLASLI